MEIKAGRQTILATNYYEEKRTVGGEQVDTIKIMLEGGISEDQISSLLLKPIEINGDLLEGFNQVFEHFIVLAKKPPSAMIEEIKELRIVMAQKDEEIIELRKRVPRIDGPIIEEPIKGGKAI